MTLYPLSAKLRSGQASAPSVTNSLFDAENVKPRILPVQTQDLRLIASPRNYLKFEPNLVAYVCQRKTVIHTHNCFTPAQTEKISPRKGFGSIKVET